MDDIEVSVADQSKIAQSSSGHDGDTGDSGVESDLVSIASSSKTGDKSDCVSDFGELERKDFSEEIDNSANKSNGDHGPGSECTTESEDEGDSDSWEIEEIIDYVNEKGGVGEMYKVKWRGFESPDFDTWEPPGNLVGCEDALLKFYLLRKEHVKQQIASLRYIETKDGKRKRVGEKPWDVPPDPRPIDLRLKAFYEKYRPLNEENLKQAYQKIVKTKLKNGTQGYIRWDRSKIDRYLEQAMDDKLPDDQMKDLRKQLYYLEVDRRKFALTAKLKEWETSINLVTGGKPTITVENEVDLEGPPETFTYVNHYIPTDGIVIPKDPPVGCTCQTSCYDHRKGCCPSTFDSKFAYNRFKKVTVPLGTPIYECNKKCSCGPDCFNRVVQNGLTDLKLCIFRTFNGCGWGVKTLKAIKRGTFVCLYTGLVVHTEDAIKRGKEQEGKNTYFFDLDFNDEENPLYSVDASTHGNVAHFINHSCEPNLGVYAVWVDCLDPNLPNLALFATCDIRKGEELSFDYMSSIDLNSQSSEMSQKNRQPCLCGAETCRKFLFS